MGRSGHLVGQTSVGRIFPTHREDVVEAAAIAGGMLRGEVEPTHTPRHPLDVLAQQIVAMVSVQTWDVDALFDLVRCAYAYTDLTARAFQITLEMLAGRYPSQAYRELRARLDWDRVNNKLAALPGSRMLALTNGGTIPNTGAFGAYLADGKTKLGELDEEFVFETRIGDTLMLGSQVWRVIDIDDNRVIVAEAPGAIPRMPFWRGDFPWRPYELGQRVGAFRRTVAERLEGLRRDLGLPDDTPFKEILDLYHRGTEDTERIRKLRDLRVSVVNFYPGFRKPTPWTSARRGTRSTTSPGNSTRPARSPPTARILVEVFDDALGDPRMVIHSPFGGRVNGPWGLALARRFARTHRRRDRSRDQRRRHPAAPAGSRGRIPAGHRHRHGTGGSPRAHPARTAGFGSLRRALPPERGARAAAAGRRDAANARPSGSSGCAPTTCCKSCANSTTSPSSPKPTATACKTCWTCRTWKKCSAASSGATIAVDGDRIARRPRPWRKACCSTSSAPHVRVGRAQGRTAAADVDGQPRSAARPAQGRRPGRTAAPEAIDAVRGQLQHTTAHRRGRAPSRNSPCCSNRWATSRPAKSRSARSVDPSSWIARPDRRGARDRDGHSHRDQARIPLGGCGVPGGLRSRVCACR